MSRGPGKIERAIRALFDAHPDEAFTTDELAEHCYPHANPIERKHPVAVLRAAHKVIATDRDWQEWGMLCAQGHGTVFLNHGNLKSYVSGRDKCISYVSQKNAARAAKTARRDAKEAEAARIWLETVIPNYGEDERRRLDKWAASDKRRQIELAEMRAREVQWHCAQRDGFTALADSLGARLEADRFAGIPKGCHADSTNGKATLNHAALADRIRALMVENDPDVQRAGFADIAAALDAAGGAP